MAQNDKLENLVNEVDSKARQFASFDDFLASQKKDGDTTWQKPADVVVENSSPDSSEKAVETDASSSPSSAEVASAPAERDSRALEMEKPGYIESGLKTEPLAHPVAPPVTFPAPPPEANEKLPEITRRIEITQLEWAGQDTKVISDFVEIDETDPEWWQGVFHSGKSFSVETEPLDEIVRYNNQLERAMKKIKVFQNGLRAGIEQRIKGVNEETRGRVSKGMNQPYIMLTNQKSAERMKTERAPKAAVKVVGAGVKLAFALGNMGLDKDEIIEKLKEKGKFDDETLAYIDKNCNDWSNAK